MYIWVYVKYINLQGNVYLTLISRSYRTDYHVYSLQLIATFVHLSICIDIFICRMAICLFFLKKIEINT